MQHGRQGYGGKTGTLLSGWSRDELLEHFQRVVMEDIAAAGMLETSMVLQAWIVGALQHLKMLKTSYFL